MISHALSLAALDLLTGIGIALVIATVAVVYLEVRRERRLPRTPPPAVYMRGESNEAFSGPHPNGWPTRKPTPVGHVHLGKTRLPDSEERRAA
jgi:hypothetical protein